MSLRSPGLSRTHLENLHLNPFCANNQVGNYSVVRRTETASENMLSHTKCILETYGHASGHAVTLARSRAKLRSLTSAIINAPYRCSSSSHQRKHNRIMRRTTEDISRPNINIYIYMCVCACVYTQNMSAWSQARDPRSRTSRARPTPKSTHVVLHLGPMSTSLRPHCPEMTCSPCHA